MKKRILSVVLSVLAMNLLVACGAKAAEKVYSEEKAENGVIEETLAAKEEDAPDWMNQLFISQGHDALYSVHKVDKSGNEIVLIKRFQKNQKNEDEQVCVMGFSDADTTPILARNCTDVYARTYNDMIFIAGVEMRESSNSYHMYMINPESTEGYMGFDYTVFFGLDNVQASCNTYVAQGEEKITVEVDTPALAQAVADDVIKNGFDQWTYVSEEWDFYDSKSEAYNAYLKDDSVIEKLVADSSTLAVAEEENEASAEQSNEITTEGFTETSTDTSISGTYSLAAEDFDEYGMDLILEFDDANSGTMYNGDLLATFKKSGSSYFATYDDGDSFSFTIKDNSDGSLSFTNEDGTFKLVK